jgi:hypothetical protein
MKNVSINQAVSTIKYRYYFAKADIAPHILRMRLIWINREWSGNYNDPYQIGAAAPFYKLISTKVRLEIELSFSD